MAAVAGRPGPWLPGARYGNLCMPAFRLSLRTAVTAPSLRCLWSRPGYWRRQQRQVDQLINRESLRLLDSCPPPRATNWPTIWRLRCACSRPWPRPWLGRRFTPRRPAAHLWLSDTLIHRALCPAPPDQPVELWRRARRIHGVRLEPDGHYRLILQDRSTQGTLQIFEGLQPGPPMSSLAGYDPRVRPWYQPAIREDGPHWSPIYTVTGTGVMPRFPQPLRCVCPASWPACWPPMCG